MVVALSGFIHWGAETHQNEHLAAPTQHFPHFPCSALYHAAIFT